MEIDDGPPPFCGVPDDSNDSIEFGKSHSFHEDDDHGILCESDCSKNTSNIKSESDVSTAQSFSRISINENETTASTENDGLNDDWSKFESSSKSEGIENIVENDEWGDFGEAPKQTTSHQDDDEWGDFDQARPVEIKSTEDGESERKLSQQKSIEEWSSFENAEPGTKNDDDDWQAEFSSASATVAQEETINFKPLDEILGDEDFWDHGFDESDVLDKDFEHLQMCDIPSLYDSDQLSHEFINEDMDQRKCAMLWLYLRVVEDALSLKFEWKLSKVQKNHFLALKIDPNCTPTTNKTPFETSNILLPTPAVHTSEISTGNYSSNFNTMNGTKVDGNPNKISTSESPPIPVVDFDWDTSGLTNPLKGASQSSAIIDVDFLATNGMATSYTNPLQKDLADFGLNSVSKTINGQSSNILESIMSKAKETSGHTNSFQNSQVLSLDAKNLLEQLPDLQYLQANMLCFPMGSGTKIDGNQSK